MAVVAFPTAIPVNGTRVRFVLTKKAQSFDKWLTIHKLVSNKLHLTEEGLAQVRAWQKQINMENGMTKKTGSAHP